MASTTQFAYRSLQGIGIVNAAPDYTPLADFERPQGNLRCCSYSPCGRYFAWALPDRVVVIDASSGANVSTLPAENVFELGFSPLGTYIITWQRSSKDENGDAVKNLKVWRVVEDPAPEDPTQRETVGKFVQKSQTGWNLQYTFDERFCARVVTNEIQIYESHDLRTVWNKLRVEGVTDFAISPGENHSIAVFVPERKGLPASVKVYNVPHFETPASQKNFFKGDKVQLKWNDQGTSLIVLAQTEVDKTGKSYYGETVMYIMSANGGFDSRIDLDKEGPIHDVTWSPKSTSFAVVYGYMPAKTVIFNTKAEPVHTFPLGPRNTVLYSPHGRFVLIAGFGNLTGQMDIYDLEKDFAKISTIEASNASVCEWSPDGRHILTATTSPRLRVDNGIRIWYANGPLMYNEEISELYHVCWRPQPPSTYPLDANLFNPTPAPHSSATLYMGNKKTPSKPAGAYRPPGARGQVTPLAFRREDEGGAAFVREGISSFSSTINGFGRARPRTVPGAETVDEKSSSVPGAAPTGGVPAGAEGADGEPLSKAAKKNAKKREAKKAAAAAATVVEPTASSTLSPPIAGTPTKSPSRSPERRQGHGHERSRSKGFKTAPSVPPGFGLEAPNGPSGRERSRSGARRSRTDSSSAEQSHQQQHPPHAPHQNGVPKGPSSSSHGAAATPKPKLKSIPMHHSLTPASLPPKGPSTPSAIAIPATSTFYNANGTPDLEVTSPTTPGGASSANSAGGSAQEKKVRGLLKKIRAIEDLKMRHAGGEDLEDTQVKKIMSEDQVRRELAAMGTLEI